MSSLKGNEVVITGISGLFPDADDILQLEEKLYNKIDMVKNADKYQYIKHPEFPQYLGSIKGMEKFDAPFFRVPFKQALCMDPSIRKNLELALSAIFDAGINPEVLKKSKLGVYIASTTIDSHTSFTDSKGHPFILTGSSKCMAANRISYWIDGIGPSFAIDQGYAGSMSALEMAYNDMKSNKVDCAIVGGCNYLNKPELTLNMKRAGLLCLDGKTKCFDKNGDGFVKSDAINVLFLQKAKDAKRIYSEIYHVKGKYFASPDGLFTPRRDPKDIENFLNEFYSEVDVDPKDVEYIEANSFGIAEADGEELQAIGNLFKIENGVKVGSIKSNMGHTESASGVCSITKLCLAYRNGQIPANLHFNEPQTDIKAVKENKIKVVTENEKFNRKFTAINNFCYTGSNFHALLKGHYKPKDQKRYKSPLPRLYLVSSRKEEGVNKILDKLESNPIDPEQHALLNNIFKYYLPGYTARGYTILGSNDKNETKSLSRGFEYFSGTSRPVWFLYSGMGSQWAGMGEGLMEIPVFAAAIKRCHNVLLTKGLDLIDIISNKDAKNLNILKSLVAITAIQIGLTDVLKSLGIVPDNFIGHSLGEICCAYADGALSMEQTILASYFRAIVSHETEFIDGTMAAVGLGYKEVVKLCPPEIQVACHNSFESATISGPSDAVKAFVKNLTSQGIFAKEVASYNIAFHSRYIAEAGPKMLELLKSVIKDPKPRSNKWLSTSYLPEDWHKPDSKFASAEYFTHNLMNSVLFEETATLIPEDAIIIEIAPHGLLQAIMKRSHSKCVNVSLTRRNENESALFFLKSLGSLYQHGINSDLECLYPKVEFPVSSETSLLSHLVEWDHDTDWIFNTRTENIEEVSKEFIFSALDDNFSFLQCYIQNGSVYNLPEAAILVFVWETLAASEKKDYNKTLVKFNDLKFYCEVYIRLDEIVKLNVSIQKCSGKFEVLYKDRIVAGGLISLVQNANEPKGDIIFNENDKHLTQDNIYTLLRLRGYLYNEDNFQFLKSMNITRNKATIIWSEQNGWINFLDSIFKMQALSEDHDGVSHIKLINSLRINTDVHKYLSFSSGGDVCYNALITKNTGLTQCGGVIIKDMVLEETPKNNHVTGDSSNFLVNVPSNKITQCNDQVCTNGRTQIQSTKLIANLKGNFESLSWVDASVAYDKTTVQVHYSGLSSKDVYKLSSSDIHSFGMDFSGIDNRGQRVMGLVSGGAAASTVQVDYNNDLLWPVPQHWSLEDAATVPLPYVHAFYCLTLRHTLSKNQTILVIGAAGALGQALISVALYIGCRIYGTVGNAEKKKFLLRLFPELDENNIGYTYDGSFRAMVIEQTKNRRCNVVISCAAGKIREDAMSCVSEEALKNYFLDVNESDQYKNEYFTMAYLVGDKTYKSVNLSHIFDDKFRKYKQILQNKLTEGITEGFVKPLTRVIYSPLNVSKAFKLLSNRCNRGRVILNTKELGDPKHNLSQIPRIVFYPKKEYIVICDGSELGVELINLLIERGAKRLLIHCSPKSINGYFHVRYASWKKKGVSIEICSDDLQSEENCFKFVEDVKHLGFVNVDGIFVACNAIRELIINNVNKLAVTVANLDNISRGFKNLRFFCVINAVTKDSSDIELNLCQQELEKCCLRRSQLGLPSLFLQHTLGDKVWTSKSLQTLFNGLETSLKEQFVSVSTFSLKNDITSGTENGNTKFDAGFSAFYRKITKHEFDATEPIVQMKTKVSSVYENELTVDPYCKNIILIPGFDGNSENLVTVAERLKIPAISLQTDLYSNDGISEIANKMLDHLKVRFQIKTPFYIMGYSFGVNIALEIAALLEKQGHVGVVYCLDSSPDALRIQLDAYLGNLSEGELQNLLIEHIYSLFVGHHSNDLKDKLKEADTWLDKVELFVKTAKTEVFLSHEYMRTMLQAVYNRIKIAQQYKPDFVLKSKLILMKGIPHPKARNLSNDYNLSLYSDKTVQVFDIKSDHAMALSDCRVSNFINRALLE